MSDEMYLHIKFPVPKNWKVLLAAMGATSVLAYVLYTLRSSLASSSSTSPQNVKLLSSRKIKNAPKQPVKAPNSVNSAILASEEQGHTTLESMKQLLLQLEKSIQLMQQEQANETSSTSSKLLKDLKKILADIYIMMEEHKQELIDKDRNFALDISASADLQQPLESETESFFSAQDTLDLTDLELLISQSIHVPFYNASLRTLDDQEIQCRKLRTSLFECQSDIEYLAKLISIRSAFDRIFSQKDISSWMTEVGKITGARLLFCVGASYKDFVSTYEALVKRVQEINLEPEPQDEDLEAEFKQHGVPTMNFYDVVLDYILVDAFELLSSPPSTILTVTQNRWLSDNFKKTTLDSAVWTLLMAKRKLLGNQTNGFFAHYYNLVGTFIGPLAWTFMGCDSNLNRIGQRVQDILFAFLKNLFAFHHTCQIQMPDPFPDVNNAILNGFAHSIQPDDSVSDAEYEDDSTVVMKEGTPPLSPPPNRRVKVNSSSKTQPPFSSGMRFQTLPELSRDVFTSLIECLNQLNSVFADEAKRSGIKIPDEISSIPTPPELEWQKESEYLDFSDAVESGE